MYLLFFNKTSPEAKKISLQGRQLRVSLNYVTNGREFQLVTGEYHEKLLNKRARFLEVAPKSKGVHMILISAQDVVRNAYIDEFQKIISLDALFAPYITV